MQVFIATKYKMKNLKRYLSFLLIVLSAVSCSSAGTKTNSASVTILPLKHLVDCLTDSSIKVNVLVPQGMSPENCDFTINTLKGLGSSRICFMIGGLPFEENILRHELENMKIPSVSLKEACSEKGTGDPHLWLVPQNLRDMIPVLAEGLKKEFPGLKEKIEENAEKLDKRLAGLDEKYKKNIALKKNRAFVIFHPSLTQLSRTYGLEQIAIEHNGKESGPARIAAIIERVRQDRINILLIQKENDRNIIENISQEAGCRVFPFNPLEENIIRELDRLSDIMNTYL